MHKLLTIAIFLCISSRAFGQTTPTSSLIIGEWHSKKHNKISLRILSFGNDSTYTQSSGGVTILSKYYFENNRLVVLMGSKEYTDVVFYGKNKFKFSGYSDTLTDPKYKLTFKRKR
jgi:hypothetical protein